MAVFSDLAVFGSPATSIAIAISAILVAGTVYLFSRPAFPSNAPPFVNEAWPIFGSVQFFTERSDFFRRQMAHSPSGNFSFYAGDKPIVGLSTPEAKRMFFEHKNMGFTEGYNTLLAAGPKIDPEDNFQDFFSRAITTLLKGNVLANRLPQLLADVRRKVDELADQESKITDPFHSIYRIVFLLTMRTVACDEIAGDEKLREDVLQAFEVIDESASPISIMYGWVPVLASVRRFLAGTKLYMIMRKIIDQRATAKEKATDALQYLIDRGYDTKKVITFVLGALFAGQLNSGINAAWMLIFLSKNKEWDSIVRKEVEAVANKYCTDRSLLLIDRLHQVPMTAWESDFPMIDLCLKECIRLTNCGTMFRRNTAGTPLALDKEGREIIPTDGYAAISFPAIHLDPTVYRNPLEFDPSRYMADRAEDKSKPYAFTGWGAGRHPCLGMRFAKMENNIITAFWVARFVDVELQHEDGSPAEPPKVDYNMFTAHKPHSKVYLKYKLRKD